MRERPGFTDDDSDLPWPSAPVTPDPPERAVDRSGPIQPDDPQSAPSTKSSAAAREDSRKSWTPKQPRRWRLSVAALPAC